MRARRPGFSISSKAPRLSAKRRLWVVITILALLAGATAGAGPSATSGEGQDAAENTETPTSDADDRSAAWAAADGSRTTARLIPDQRALLGAPDTVIDLQRIFAATEIAESGGPLRLELNPHNKKDVAEARIEGDRLILHWGKKTNKRRDMIVRATNEAGDYVDTKFHVELWQPDYWQLALMVIGGLGLFLLGMKSMSEGLQAIAGEGLRRMISIATDNRFLATSVGVLVTMLVQSSSITTVMVVGFVNSGFMTLSQAIGVVMGANIGTTITGWILVLKIGAYGLPMLGVGAFGYLFIRSDRWRYAAMALMGLGMVFFGLETMKDGFAVLKDLPDFEVWFATFSAQDYLGVLKCALVGCVLTLIVQSSSATLGITIGLAQMEVIGVDTAAALVLGENVGTTITAFLASFGTTTNARRAAYFHVIFNLFGVAWITAIFLPFYLPAVKSLVAEMRLWSGDSDSTAGALDPAAVIATTHSCFNIANTLLFLPFVGLFAALLSRIVPEKKHKEKPHLTSLDIRMLETPAMAIEQSRNEILRMADGCNKMMDWLKLIATSDSIDEDLVQRTFHREEVLDTIQDEIVTFLSDMLAGNMPHDVINEARRQLRMADEYESISDYIVSILKSHLRLARNELNIADDQQIQLLKLHDVVADYLRLISQGYSQRQPEVITKAHTLGDRVKNRVSVLRNEFLEKMSDERPEPQVSVAFTGQLNAYRRIRDHALNIAEALAGLK